MELAIVAIVLLLCTWLLRSWSPRGHVERSRALIGAIALGAVVGVCWLAAPRPVPEAAVVGRPIQVPDEGDVGSTACRACHPDQYASWDASYHSTMTQLPTPETVRAPWNLRLSADWDGVTRSYLLERRGDEFWVRSQDEVFASPRGPESGERRIVLLTGSHHQQFYWYSTHDERRIAQLPLGYSIRESRWAPIHALLLSPGGPPQDVSGGWNSICVRCHSTHGRPRMENSAIFSSLAGVRMDTEATEFGIACESCHGGAERHVAQYRNPVERYAMHFADGEADGIVNPENLDPKRATEVCGSCHSVNLIGQGRPEDLARFNRVGFDFRPGDVLGDTRLVASWSQRDDPRFAALLASDPRFFTNHFWSDGMVAINGRELNGLLESACYTRGELSCLNCHTLHQKRDDLRVRTEWADDQLDPTGLRNDACLECHPGYLEGTDQHTRHAAGTPGSLCYNCHMPNTAYGLLKQTRSHEIDSPDVDVSRSTGRPTACSLCHLDRPLAWVAGQLESLYGRRSAPLEDPEDHFVSFAVLRALRGDAGSRAMVAWHMGWPPAQETSVGEWAVPILAVLLEDPYAAVRHLAGRSLRAQPGFEDFDYDYLAPAETLAKSRAAALARFDRLHPPATRKGGEAVLIDSDGQVKWDRIERQLERRDDRVVFRQE